MDINKQVVHPIDVFRKHYETIFERHNKPQDLPISFLPDLNRKIWGLQKKKLVIVGARPSNGKSCFLLELASSFALQGKTVYFFSFEMSKEVCVERLFSSYCEVDNWLIRTGKVAEIHKEPGYNLKLNEFYKKFENTKFMLIESIGRNLPQLNQILTMFPHKPDAIFIDYGNMVDTEARKTKKESLDEYIKGLRALAISNDFCAIMAAQINRKTHEGGKIRKPWLWELKECVIGDTLVARHKIKDIVNNKKKIKVKSLNLKSGEYENILPDRYIKSGLMDCYQIVLKSGRKVTISGNTEVFTGKEWKNLTSLSVGDKIVIEDIADHQKKGEIMEKGQKCKNWNGFKKGHPAPKTAFKKGQIPWNKGKKLPLTENQIKAFNKKKGISLPKPDNFSETMRKVNPPRGVKYKSNSQKLPKKVKVWRKKYRHLYKPEHPTSRKKPPDYGYIAEHRYVVEIHMGRLLKHGEIVHHIDGDKSNNSIDNLLLCENVREHQKIHIDMQMFTENLIRKGEVRYDKKEKEFIFIG